MNTLRPYVQQFTQGRMKRGEVNATTANDARYTLLSFADSFGDRPLRQLGPKAVDRWLETISHHSPATRRHYLSRVRVFCAWLFTEGKIRNNPTAHVKTIKQPRGVPITFTREEVGRMLNVVNGDLRAEAILLLIVGCGPRCVEVSRLQVQDYNQSKRTIRFVGKGMHERMVAVPAEAAEALDAYLDSTGRSGGPFFRSRLNPAEGLSSRTISAYFRRWAYKADVKTRAHDGRSAHGGRRTAASDIMDATGNIVIVQEVLGHADIETTARFYLRRVTMEEMRRGMEGRTYRPEPPAAPAAA